MRGGITRSLHPFSIVYILLDLLKVHPQDLGYVQMGATFKTFTHFYAVHKLIVGHVRLPIHSVSMFEASKWEVQYCSGFNWLACSFAFDCVFFSTTWVIELHRDYLGISHTSSISLKRWEENSQLLRTSNVYQMPSLLWYLKRIANIRSLTNKVLEANLNTGNRFDNVYLLSRLTAIAEILLMTTTTVDRNKRGKNCGYRYSPETALRYSAELERQPFAATPGYWNPHRVVTLLQWEI